MKNYTGFIQEAVAVPETVKALKKRFRGTKEVKRTSKQKLRLPGSLVGSVIVPKAKPSEIRDYLMSIGYKVAEEFEGFIDMYSVYYKAGVTYKAVIVSNDKSKDVEVRLSSMIKKGSKAFQVNQPYSYQIN